MLEEAQIVEVGQAHYIFIMNIDKECYCVVPLVWRRAEGGGGGVGGRGGGSGGGGNSMCGKATIEFSFSFLRGDVI